MITDFPYFSLKKKKIYKQAVTNTFGVSKNI